MKLYKLAYFSIFLVCILLTIRIDTYSSFFNKYADLVLVNPQVIEYTNNENGWGVVPKSGSSCWINIECSPEKTSLEKFNGLYNYFFTK